MCSTLLHDFWHGVDFTLFTCEHRSCFNLQGKRKVGSKVLGTKLSAAMWATWKASGNGKDTRSSESRHVKIYGTIETSTSMREDTWKPAVPSMGYHSRTPLLRFYFSTICTMRAIFIYCNKYVYSYLFLLSVLGAVFHRIKIFLIV